MSARHALEEAVRLYDGDPHHVYPREGGAWDVEQASTHRERLGLPRPAHAGPWDLSGWPSGQVPERVINENDERAAEGATA